MQLSSVVKKVSDFVSCEMKKKQMMVFLAGCFATFVLELLACLFKNIFSILASRLWFISVIFFFLFFLFVVAKQVVDDVRAKKIMLPVIFLLILAFFVFQIGNYGFSDLSYESTDEVVAGLKAFEQPDWNYTGKGFTGYPVKQYLINAIPTLLFGRNFMALNLGFAIPFLTGLILIFIEIRKLCIKLEIDEKYSILPIFFISFCPFIDEFYYIFEQAITPVSYTMIIIALFFRLMRERSLLSFIVLTLSTCMLPFLYTPALALMGLYFVMMIYHAITVKTEKSNYIEAENKNTCYFISILASAVMPCLFFVCTLAAKRDDRFLTTYGDAYSAEKQSEYIKSFLGFFVDADSPFWGIFGAIVLIYLVAALTMRLKFHDLLIALWSVATVLISFILPGVAIVFNFYYNPLTLAQRSLIIVPVIAVSLLIASSDFIRKHDFKMRRDWLAILAAAFLLFGVNSLFQKHKGFEYNNYIQHMKYIMNCCEEMNNNHGKNSEEEIVIVIHTENGMLVNARDFVQYFFPNAKVYLFPTEQHGGISIYDTIFPRYIISESDKTAGFYNMEFQSQEFKNYRYDEDTKIYFQYIDPDYSYVDQYNQEYINKYNLQKYQTKKDN